jgi:hypothetical protein
MFSLPSRTLPLSNPSISSSESLVCPFFHFSSFIPTPINSIALHSPVASGRPSPIVDGTADYQMVSSPTVSTSRNSLLCTNSRTSTFRPRRRLTISSEVISMVITISTLTTRFTCSLLVDTSLGIKVLICLLSLLLVSPSNLLFTLTYTVTTLHTPASQPHSLPFVANVQDSTPDSRKLDPRLPLSLSSLCLLLPTRTLSRH